MGGLSQSDVGRRVEVSGVLDPSRDVKTRGTDVARLGMRLGVLQG